MKDRSVSAWLEALQAGDAVAAGELWQRCHPILLRYARQRLKGPRRVADEEDVVLSAFASFCRGAERAAFAKLDGRDDLWQLLFMITARKTRRQVQSERRDKRGGGKVWDEAALEATGADSRPIEQFPSQMLSAEFAMLLDDELERLMKITGDDTLREVALLRLEGYSNPEISEKTGRALRSVERKLRLIRDLWENP